MTELDSFIDWAKNQDLDVTIVDFSGAVKLLDKNGEKRDFCFEEFETDIAWLSWQAATQRDGFKFVPVEADAKMIKAGRYAHDSSGLIGVAYKAMIGAIDE